MRTEKNVLKLFLGEIEQTPPIFSAIKINGVRAYKLARKGKENVEIKSRNVNVFELEILQDNLIQENTVTLRCMCSKGTYIRSLARDIAKHLNTCSHVVYLRRTFVNFIDLSNTLSFDKLSSVEYNEKIEQFILPCESALDDIPALTLDEQVVSKLQKGQRVFLESLESSTDRSKFKILGKHNNVFYGVCETDSSGKILVPLRMIV